MPPLVPPGGGKEIRAVAQAYQTATHNLNARQCPRVGWLFRKEEGYRLDALPREAFEGFLDTAEECLSNEAPFFGGATNVTAADFVWAPLLERYAAQLPCLHAALNPRDSHRWPKLAKWYQAMEMVPAYACRIRGDASSWRKVLYREPWWPAADLWHPRETVGPKGEILLNEDSCIASYGNVAVPPSVWNSYALGRSVGRTLSMEAAVQLIRNRKAIRADAEKWM